MRPAAIIALLALSLGPIGLSAEPAATRIGGVEYVNVEDAAAALGLKTEHLGTQSVILKDGSRPVVKLNDRSREILLNGLRMFLGDPVEERSGVLYISRVDYRARLEPRLRPRECRPVPNAPRIIAIDPGHGGEDQGTSNRSLGLLEKTCTLDVSMRLKKLLEAAGYVVVMTRETDVDMPKALRPEIANRAGADLFVSIHFNSLYPNTTTTGAEVLTFAPRTQRSTDSWSLGAKNDAEGEEVPGNRFDGWNTILAGAVHRRVVEGLKDGDRGEKIAHLAVLRGIKCPAVLIEAAIIASEREGALLATSDFRERIATAVFQGIEDYAAMLKALGAAPGASVEPAPQAGPAQAQAAPVRSSPTRPSGP